MVASSVGRTIASAVARAVAGIASGGGGGGGPSYDYLIENDAGWDTVFANDDATLSGTTIALAPGSYTAKTLTDRAFTSEVKIIAQTSSNKPVIDEIILDGCDNLTFENIAFVSSTWAVPSGQCVLLTGDNSSLKWDRCTFTGNYRGTVGSISVVDDLPEYACIAADVTAGAISALEVTKDYVGDLLSNGTYNIDFSPAGGTGAIATFDVVDGFITGTTLTNGGTGYTTAAHRTRRAIWVGQNRMLDYLPWAIRSNSPCTINGIEVRDCSFSTFANAYKPSGYTGPVTLIGNTFQRTYMDVMSMGLTHPTSPYPIEIAWNFNTLPFSVAQEDAGDPHSDFVQIFADDLGGAGNVTTADWENIRVYGNIHIDGTARGSVQGSIIADQPSGVSYSGLYYAYNLIASKVQPLGMTIVNPRDCYVMSNATIRFDPTLPGNASSQVQVRVPGVQDDPGGGYYGYGSTVVGNNIAEGFPANGVALPEVNRTKFSNVDLGTAGSRLAYASVFANPTASRTSIAEIVAAYAPTVTYAGKGPFANTSLVDHVNRTVNTSLEPSYFYFATSQGVTASTTVTSSWSRVMGGPTTRTISVSNGEYRMADDSSGTNATSWTSSSGTMTIGKFVQVRHTSSAVGSGVTTTTLTIGSDTATFSSVTAGVSAFDSIDNQTTAYSRFAKTGITDTGIRKVLLAIRCKPDAIVQNANWIAETAATAQRLFFPTTGAWRYQAISSTRVNLRPALTPTTDPITHIISLDFTNSQPNEGAIWVTDQTTLLNNSAGTGGVFDTRTTAGSGTDYGSLTLAATGTGSLLGAAASHIGLFAEGDGGGVIADGAIEFFWMDWGDENYTLPDITDPVVKAKFTSDNIGANGNGPTGSQPKLFFTGDAAAWNDAGGLANLGSIASTPLIKQAGTYV